MSPVRLTRSESDKVIAGVCGGLAEYLGVDSALVRLAFILLGLASGVGIPLYIILMIIVPREDTIDQPISEIVKDNLDDLGNTVSSSLERNRTHPNGRNIAAVALILIGVYLLFEQLGWINAAVLWPLVLIGIGVYIIVRRSRRRDE